MKLRVDNIIKYFLIIIFLLENSFFYIFNLPKFILKINNEYQKILIVSLILFLIIIMHYSGKTYKYKFKKGICFFIFIYFVEVIVSCIRYNQSIFDTILNSNYYLIILLYFPLLYFLRTSNNIKFLKNLFIYSTLILVILFIMQVYIFDFKFLNINFDKFRFGTLRILESSNIIVIGTIFSFFNFIQKGNSKVLNFITFLLGFFEIIFIQKSRMLIIILSSIFSLCLLYQNRKKKLKMIIMILVTILFACMFINSKIGVEYLNSFDSEKVSVDVRKEAIHFYLDQTKDNFILGTGFINVKNDNYDNYNEFKRQLLNGYENRYYKSDVGIVGLYNTWGISGVLLYIIFIIYSIKLILKYLSKKISNIDFSIVSIFLLIIFSTFNSIYTDVYRIITLPLFLAILEFFCDENKSLN
ncbi:hypothetical protein GNF54_09030 [Clostridium perfringens]|uniref:O-antigen ligase family protein n=2 Tax=Clostridium perfringens TaxID=1502 RepID=UPI002852FAF2|nr:O-antigen ligase family protein [Clostridium perfringens]MDZ5048926.1 hypothetical protein [Clostridium perfringens]CAJ1609388.1 hypothetical protein CLO5623_00809 [Clostridium perfringens]